MPRTSPLSLLQNKPRKQYNQINKRQNKSYLSESNVICQDRKLRGRILKPVVWHCKKRQSKLSKKLATNHTVVESKKMEVPETVQNIVRDVNLDNILVVQPNRQTIDVLLYKTIQRLWYENLHVFIYYSDTVEFSNFIQSFPNLIAVQIKVLVPLTSETEMYQILSAKNFIFQRNAFVKLIHTTFLDTSTRNTLFMLHGPINDQPRTIILPTKRPAKPPTYENNEQPKPLDLRISQVLEPNNTLNRNIVNKLQRLNTVIRRLPADKKSSMCRVTYRKQNFNSRQTNNFNYGNLSKHKPILADVIEPPAFRTWQKDCAFKGTLLRYGVSYKKPDITLKSSIIYNEANQNKKTINMKTAMWMTYSSGTESFGRAVPLAELDAIPIETLFNPGEDFNLADYL